MREGRKGEVRRKERNREEQRAGRAGEGGEEDGRGRGEGGREGGKAKGRVGGGKMEHNVVSLHSAPVKWSTLSLSHKHTLSHLHKTVCVRASTCHACTPLTAVFIMLSSCCTIMEVPW